MRPNQRHKVPLRIALLISAAIFSGCGSTNLGTGTTCEATAQNVFPTKRALLAFQACNGTLAECDESGAYQVWLAESDDLLNWNIVENWVPFSGTDTDLVVRSSLLYFYSNPGTVRTLDLTQGTLSCAQNLELIDDDGANRTESTYALTPVVRESDNRIVVAFFKSEEVKASDTRTCETLPCTRTLSTAVETASGVGVRFQITSGSRVSLTLTSSDPLAFDPDLIKGDTSDGFLVSMARDDTTIEMYASATLEGIYTNIGEVLNHGSTAAILFDSENYWFVGSNLDTETPQNRVIKLYGSSTLSALPASSSPTTFEGVDYPALGTGSIQVKDPALVLLE